MAEHRDLNAHICALDDVRCDPVMFITHKDQCGSCVINLMVTERSFRRGRDDLY